MRHLLPITCFLLLGIASAAAGQTSAWPHVIARGHVAFDLPDRMEVDSASFSFTRIDQRDVYTLSDGYSTISAGSKDDETLNPEDTLRAANLVVDIRVAEPGTFASLGSELNFTKEELDLINENMRTGFLRQAEQEGTMHDVDWVGTDVLQLEQAQALRLRFSGRVGANGDDYIVNVYIIQNYDTAYYVTISYLRTIAEDWIQDLDAAFRTFRFEKRG